MPVVEIIRGGGVQVWLAIQEDRVIIWADGAIALREHDVGKLRAALQRKRAELREARRRKQMQERQAGLE